jgi:hypothetical protein
VTPEPTDLADQPAFRQYQRVQIAELRPYVRGESLANVSLSEVDRASGSPRPGDLIARNPKNHDDQWLVAAGYFADNFTAVAPERREIGSRCITCGQRHDAEQDRDTYHEVLLEGLLHKQSGPADEDAFWAAHGGVRLLSNKVRADDYRRDVQAAEAMTLRILRECQRLAEERDALKTHAVTAEQQAVLTAVGEVGPRALKNPRTYGEDFAEVCEAAITWRKAKAGT